MEGVMGLFRSDWHDVNVAAPQGGEHLGAHSGSVDDPVDILAHVLPVLVKAAEKEAPSAGRLRALVSRVERHQRANGVALPDGLVVCDGIETDDGRNGCGRISLASEGRWCSCGAKASALDPMDDEHMSPAARDFMRDTLAGSPVTVSGSDDAIGLGADMRHRPGVTLDRHTCVSKCQPGGHSTSVASAGDVVCPAACGQPLACGSVCCLDRGHDTPCECGGDEHGRPGTCPA